MLPNHRDQIAGILLAAGKGSRFDPSGAKNKLLQSVDGDEMIVVAAAKKLLSALPLVIAVVRDTDDAVAAKLSALGCKVVVCPNADQGMGESLVCGVQQTLDAVGWIIALGDMPYVQSTTIASLVDALRQGADIAAPVYQNKRGNPVGFGKIHLPELLKLGHDHGARALLKIFPVTAVNVNDPGIHRDIDTPADLTE
jgi:molybdenum cofactor cytidylyltransferase